MIWVSERAARLNQEDKFDLAAFAQQAICNGGSAWTWIYVAEVKGDDVYVVTYSEKQKEVEL